MKNADLQRLVAGLVDLTNSDARFITSLMEQGTQLAATIEELNAALDEFDGAMTRSRELRTRSARLAKATKEDQNRTAATRRSRAISDPAGRFATARDFLIENQHRLSKKAIAIQMEIDAKTLDRYIGDGLIPSPPWE